MSRNKFFAILSSCVVLISIFIIFVPGPVKKKVEEGVKRIESSLNLNVLPRQTSIMFVGDVMLGRTVMTTSLNKDDPSYPWHKVADKLNYADLVFANLETPVVENCPSKTDGMIFCADPRMVEGLKYAGVDVVTLANNHTLNYGKEGLAETKKILAGAGIEYTDQSLAVREVNGVKFGFLGFEFVDSDITDDQLELTRALNDQVDTLIVGVHWGSEYQDKAGAKQREIARKLVNAGADVVVGHPPHWVQDMEHIGDKPVYYSLGNFVFDQMWSEETRHGLAIKLTFDSMGKVVGEERLPIYMKDWAQPEWVE